MNFASDNTTGAAPEILAAIAAANADRLMTYGNDDLTLLAHNGRANYHLRTLIFKFRHFLKT